VLSACDTAGGRVQRGEGVIGLSWAILATGCPRAIATQWRVGSASAARLMIAFHQKLAAQKTVTNVARCLRDAQIGMLGHRIYAHPYYWAGFVLVGRDD
jgi:CHAT domain-containing protein